jgi:hypothetical protein
VTSRLVWVALALVVLAIPLTIAACGGDDDDDGGDGGGDQDEITAAIETATTGTDPGKCTTVMTQQFVEQVTFETGPTAVGLCREGTAPATPADSVDVANIEVDGDTATAEVAVTGGGRLDGQTIVVSLVKEGDQWKLDHLDEFIEFDQGAFADAVVEEASEAGEPRQTLDCIRDAIDTAGPEQSQAIYVSDEPGGDFGLFGYCVEG